MGFVGHASGEWSCFAPFYWHGINVSHEVKGDGFSIRADVQAHPSTFGSGETYFPLRLEGKVFEFWVTLERVFFGAIRLNVLGT